ncbi:unnamed protein product [Prorocentrum cordatum]|uniref:Feruloyl esterase n=1 Tax=Prorocentrum cordatum TaxID=2364126 RepID=A0ABN9PCQ9_9DINO|nr:unnamed protein product [Polarella glacialis]
MSTRQFDGAAYVRVETDPLLSDVDVEPQPSLLRSYRCYCAVCACSLLALVLPPWLYFFLVKTTAGMAVGRFLTIDDLMVQEFCHQGLTMENITYNNWWPGCLYGTPRQNCTDPCYDVSILERMDAFNKQYPGQLVTYQSRSGPMDAVELTGWWLPAPNESAAPRIVLQHGFEQNSNAHSPQLAAYMLRSLGFSVFLPNLRDHCYSSNTSEHVYQWSSAYPLDLLGAWDYVVADPNGLLGGQREARHVGLQGFSQGAFVASAAFGLDRRRAARRRPGWTPGPGRPGRRSTGVPRTAPAGSSRIWGWASRPARWCPATRGRQVRCRGGPLGAPPPRTSQAGPSQWGPGAKQPRSRVGLGEAGMMRSPKGLQREGLLRPRRCI